MNRVAAIFTLLAVAIGGCAPCTCGHRAHCAIECTAQCDCAMVAAASLEDAPARVMGPPPLDRRSGIAAPRSRSNATPQGASPPQRPKPEAAPKDDNPFQELPPSTPPLNE